MSTPTKAVINVPLPLEKSVVAPTSVYCPMLMFATGCVTGQKLQTSLQIQFSAAKVENAGTKDEKWTPTGQNNMIHLFNIDALEPDLAILVGDNLAKVYADLLVIVGKINNARKLL